MGFCFFPFTAKRPNFCPPDVYIYIYVFMICYCIVVYYIIPYYSVLCHDILYHIIVYHCITYRKAIFNDQERAVRDLQRGPDHPEGENTSR